MSTLKLLTMWVMTLTLLACQSAPTASSKTGAPVAAPVPVLRQVVGNDPALRFPAVMLIKTQAELDALRAPELASAQVDFTKESLVVVALGEKPTGGYWALVTAVQLVGDHLFVQGLANRPGKDEVGPQVVRHPFAAAVIAKTSATTVRSDVQSVVGQKMPPIPNPTKP